MGVAVTFKGGAKWAGWVGLSIADQQRKIRVLQMRDIPSTFFVLFRFVLFVFGFFQILLVFS